VADPALTWVFFDPKEINRNFGIFRGNFPDPEMVNPTLTPKNDLTQCGSDPSL